MEAVVVVLGLVVAVLVGFLVWALRSRGFGGGSLDVEFGLSRFFWRRSSGAVLEDGFNIRP